MGAGSNFMDFLPIILIVAFFYFFILRPQQQRTKRQKELLDSLAEGNEVITACGMLGKIVSLNTTIVHLEVASGVVIMVQRTAIATLLPPGTMASPDQLSPPAPSCCA
jgi:preprotein translocase subunit YajC